MSTALKTPTVLAFQGKLSTSDALMESGQWEKRNDASHFQPVVIKEKVVRGTISNRMKSPLADDPAKIDAEVQKANPQTMDSAALPFGQDTLKVRFSLNVLGDLAIPSACNGQDYQQALAKIINSYTEETKLTELANRYATNIANGRFLWRNRIGASAVEVQVTCGEKRWVFDGHQFSLDKFEKPAGDLAELAEVIRQGLLGERVAMLKIVAFAQLEEAQPVYPSQELVMGIAKGEKGKYLYQLNGVAALHSQKIGNALRTIDTWHDSVNEAGAIAIEPYGAVTSRGHAYRQPKDRMDFYRQLDNWVLKGKVPPLEQQHYIMAMFIRGGVFGQGA